MTQKIYRNGNSAAVTIPKEFLIELNLKPGSSVVLERRAEGIFIVPEAKRLAGDVDSEFAKWVDEFVSEHEDALKELAKR